MSSAARIHSLSLLACLQFLLVMIANRILGSLPAEVPWSISDNSLEHTVFRLCYSSTPVAVGLYEFLICDPTPRTDILVYSYGDLALGRALSSPTSAPQPSRSPPEMSALSVDSDCMSKRSPAAFAWQRTFRTVSFYI
ncbi:hypothetical protein B0T14DRAFT_172043 [Immersiella caudata]|uniref:Uncharacterized protein n=1 Tax=Immersiella caudata TaxID=314043 RepID=A0AA39WXY3_9PEZI|nr:hypothetical protein B0T14DRAFT_172043 [Immersiella caudata]